MKLSFRKYFPDISTNIPRCIDLDWSNIMIDLYAIILISFESHNLNYI